MERFTRPLMAADTACASSSARAACATASLAAFRELGGAYLAIIGGTAALETTWIEAIEDVDLDDLNPGVAVEIPRPRLRAAAGRDGQPRRQPLRHASTRRARAGARARGRSRALGRASRDGASRRRSSQTDILILGAGGAGLFAALHAHAGGARRLSITIAVKGLLGKCGCTRMVQGGYNVALAPGRFGRAPLHGHDRGRQVAARPGSRLDAGDEGDRAHPRAGERARLLLRPQSRRHASTRRPSPARPSTAPCTRAT